MRIEPRTDAISGSCCFRFLPIWLAALLSIGPISLAGCATILKGWHRNIPLAVAPQTVVHNYSGHDAAAYDEDGEKYLKLTSDEEYILEYNRGGNRDSVALRSRLEPEYLLADMIPAWPISVPVDIATGAAYGFWPASITFRTFPDSLKDTLSLPELNIYDLNDRGIDEITDARFAPRLPRFVLMVHMGAKSPFNQVPILGNDFGVGLGYRIVPSFVLMGYYGGDSYMDYAPPGSSLYMEARGSIIALEGRLYPLKHALKHLYGTAGAEYRTMAVDSMEEMNVHLPGFSQSMAGISAGAGISTQGFFIEARNHWGLRRVHIADGILSGPVSNFAIRFGLNLEF